MAIFSKSKPYRGPVSGCCLALGIFLLTGLLNAATAWAHKATVFAWVEGHRIYTESRFSGGRKVNQGKIQVYDDLGKLLLEGTTDAQGAFDFEVPKICDLKIVLIAGMGHQNQWIVPAGEIREAAGLPPADKSGGIDSAPKQSPGPSEKDQPAAVSLSPEIEKQLEKILDRKLHPLVRQLAKMQDRGPSLQDILGGIGYILGLVGLGAYFNYRRQTKGEET